MDLPITPLIDLPHHPTHRPPPSPRSKTSPITSLLDLENFFEFLPRCAPSSAILSVAADTVVTDQASLPSVKEVNSTPAPTPEPGPDEDQAPGRTPSPDAREAARGPDAALPPTGASGLDGVDQAR